MPGLTYTIAELLKEQGSARANALREQAKLRADAQRASGSGWANAVAGAGQYIASIPAQKQQAQRQAALAERDALETEKLRGELSDKATARQKAEAFQAVLAKHQSIDEAVNDPALMQADPDRFSDLLNKHVLPARKAAEEERMRKQAFIASTLGSARNQGDYTKAKYIVEQVYPHDVADLPDDYEEAKPVIERQLRSSLSPKEQLEQLQKEQIPKGFTNETQLYAAAADPNHPQHQVAVDAIEMKRERPDKAETRGLDVQAADALARGDMDTYKRLLKVKKEMGQADDRPLRITTPPAQRLVKVEHKDPATGRTVIEWLPQGELVGQKFEKGTSATTETRLASAQAVNQTGEDIIAQLSDPKIARMLGPAMGRYNSLREFVGNPPPELSEIAGSIESYALANMGVHGMRSAQGAEQIKKLLDQKHTPGSLIATIRGLNKFSSHFMENEGRKTSGDSEGKAPGEWIDLGGGIKVRKK